MEFVLAELGRVRFFGFGILVLAVQALTWLEAVQADEASALSPPCHVGLVPGAIGARGGGGASLFIRPQDYFLDFETALVAKGCQVFRFELPVDGTIEERGMVLKAEIERNEGGAPFDLLAHSQGALDARYAIFLLKGKSVRSLVSIGAPMDGTPSAKWAMDQIESHSFWYYLLKWVGQYDLESLRFIPELEPRFVFKHADAFAPQPGVRYASAVALCRSGCSLPLVVSGWLTGVGPGDGLVPAQSQRWGADLGEYNLDHLSTVGVDRAKHLERMRFLDRYFDWIRLN